MQRFLKTVTENVDLDNNMPKLIADWRKFIESELKKSEGVRPWGLGYSTPQGEVKYYIRRKGKWQWVTHETAH